MTYKELDELLTHEVTDDAWYDDGVFIAQEIIENFSANDWKELLKCFMSKNISWKKKLVYSFCDNNNLNEVYIIVQLLLNSNDDELFEICIDSLRNFDKKVLISTFNEYPYLLQDIKIKILKIKSPFEKIYIDFLKKFSI